MKNNGGSAFPAEVYTSGHGALKPVPFPNGAVEWVAIEPGMSLRDYYKAKALAAVIADAIQMRWISEPGAYDKIAKRCGDIADAMIAEG